MPLIPATAAKIPGISDAIPPIRNLYPILAAFKGFRGFNKLVVAYAMAQACFNVASSTFLYLFKFFSSLKAFAAS